jgi:hypothetical protein
VALVWPSIGNHPRKDHQKMALEAPFFAANDNVGVVLVSATLLKLCNLFVVPRHCHRIGLQAVHKALRQLGGGEMVH